jgi:hypothetical protein
MAPVGKTRCVVAEKVRDKAMRRFMKGDGYENRDDPDRGQIDEIVGHSFSRLDFQHAGAAARIALFSPLGLLRDADNVALSVPPPPRLDGLQQKAHFGIN